MHISCAWLFINHLTNLVNTANLYHNIYIISFLINFVEHPLLLLLLQTLPPLFSLSPHPQNNNANRTINGTILYMLFLIYPPPSLDLSWAFLLLYSLPAYCPPPVSTFLFHLYNQFSHL